MKALEVGFWRVVRDLFVSHSKTNTYVVFQRSVLDAHRHHDVAAAVVLAGEGSDLTCAFSVLKFERDLGFWNSGKKINEILVIKADLETLFVIFDREGLVRFAQFRMAGGNFK